MAPVLPAVNALLPFHPCAALLWSPFPVDSPAGLPVEGAWPRSVLGKVVAAFPTWLYLTGHFTEASKTQFLPCLPFSLFSKGS